MRTCYNCACDPVCDHNWNGWETCGNWIQKPGEPPTNADRIRDMSDKDLANEMRKRSISTICDIVCQGECKAIATLNKTSNEVCKEIIMKWLQQPAEEET